MDYKFCINDFEGPLDLLLHLVKTSKMDIYALDIKIIIEEYLTFIEEQKNKNIDIASSYLVMAAELIHLKSKMLVNDDSTEDNNDEFHIDSEEDLKKKIIEYEKYKQITSSLEEMMNRRNCFYTKSPTNLDEIVDNSKYVFKNALVDQLIEALKNLKEREKYSRPINTKITHKEYSIEKRIIDIRKILSVKDKIEFLDLFDNMERDFLIVTFLSILTMSKNEEIELKQEDNFKPIIIERRKVHE